MLSQLRVLEPHPGILAFYDGRVAGHRFAAEPNWVDDGALSLGIASYALIAGGQAIVYDSHVSVPHGRFIRSELERHGVTDIRVVLSHWHLDHVAGTEAFADCQVIANARTLGHLTARQAAIEAGTDHGLPVISPLILPDTVFEDRMRLDLGGEPVELISANIHSDDATVLWLPDRRILLAGDTVEDCVTYVGAPEEFDIHLRDLNRLAELGAEWVLPNHGAAEMIAQGGYNAKLLAATADYIRHLQAADPRPMAEIIAPWLKDGTLRYFEPYEAVHAQNRARVQAMRAAIHAL
ncbi:MBL fold metallo-hydrolase [Cypionkella aquatica]|uniref:MBL fold metallo-hydrolase n=1 Tax=Cypionkella aquatica TaxID=1756042 RepID=A0AA37U3V2_9RHOB|nr:MBL fold metallo-hydrolase [Cypionkella aquatica]GLS87234.1 MBL fold metallo-hydrolase [Cypionkella aquatica]